MKIIKCVIISLIILSFLIFIIMSNVLVLEELYYSVEYKNIVIFNKLVKKKFLNVVYNILELYVV